ncbi:hypothetical protein BN8_05072 [Fibrisoma limi BUZ 3]|uniref:Uncharacterized protein n=1 Tax=Fibrisoma limi BUZ 3 TaxID=1185876 RepID=I2GPF7_9BACT|nr:FixH family protein [Fibrisoma limi]CCH55785.1 hypothetical protein BN8_05072 [Fibrisoma limi BUZ 3]
MTFEPATQSVAFVLPLYFYKAELTFSRLNDTFDDVQIRVTPGNLPRYVVSTAQLAKGIWHARLNWSDGQQSYHEEKEIIVG